MANAGMSVYWSLRGECAVGWRLSPQDGFPLEALRSLAMQASIIDGRAFVPHGPAGVVEIGYVERDRPPRRLGTLDPKMEPLRITI